ncbi:HAD family hydrolase [Sphingomonas baiyangensis]|uniref:HAD family hydrolase n=1 Tax=Sphingomonas baiyangensis TaxID=2572576 RepID=A0A4U1L2A0_9SPHN|nr:HAD family hydrolase [Sphingomonas baiyangensis]TKD50997.1 HAD family hydrolase [Sphingomonas baiyangensis]
MKPLLICDCDEVLLHMVRHFRDWLGEAHGIDFSIGAGDFAASMTRRDGAAIAREEMWGMLDGFFPSEMARQTPVPHAREALAALAEHADIVILTNLKDHCRDHRIDQLAEHGIAHRVECNQGGKGEPVAKLVAEHGDPVTVFVDDLAVHHDSVARHAPGVHRLHMISEPQLAAAMPPAPEAHARIDDWRAAQVWILDRFAKGLPAGAADGMARA